VRDVVLVGVSDDDLDGVVFEALGLVDRDGVGDLERHRGVKRVVVIVTGVVVVDGKAYGRALGPFQLSAADVELGERSISGSRQSGTRAAIIALDAKGRPARQS
jgi:hypothetical protein